MSLYFDNAATTYPKPKEVYDFMDKFNRTHAFNSSRGNYNQSSQSNNLVRNTREKLLNLFHCDKNKYKTIFTSSATIALNTIIMGIDYKKVKNVYITHFEHNAVLRPLYYLQKMYDFDMIVINLSKYSLKYCTEEVSKQFQSKKPDVLIMTHASNVCGLITPVQAISKLAKKYECITITDCSQTAGLVDLNIPTSNIDYAVFAGHKTLYAPFGAAGFIMKKDNVLSPLYFGGTGIDSANHNMPLYGESRYEAGSLNVLSIAGLHASIDWIDKTGIKNIREKEQHLTQCLKSSIREFNNIEIIGDSDRGIGVVSCLFSGYSPDNIGQILNKRGVAVRTGLHCAPLSHKFLGTFPSGTVRFSIFYFNTDEDIVNLKEDLKYIYDNS